MSLRAGICGFILLGVPGARADEPGAPLENSKQELKVLQKDQATHAGEASVGKLRDAMPHLQAPGSGSVPVEPPAPQKSEPGQRMDAQTNWLLDGMDQLDKNSKAKNRAARSDLTEEKKLHSAQNDPNYLLKLYDEQPRNSDAKADAKQSTASRKDPLTPFLQGWLSDSPVRGKFFDEYLRKPNTGAGSNGDTVPVLQESGADPSFAGLDSGGLGLRHGQGETVPGQTNPYLQGLDMSALHDTAVRNQQSAIPAEANPPPVSLADPGTPTRPPERKSPLPALSDDNKYFPQLKKF